MRLSWAEWAEWAWKTRRRLMHKTQNESIEGDTVANYRRWDTLPSRFVYYRSPANCMQAHKVVSSKQRLKLRWIKNFPHFFGAMSVASHIRYMLDQPTAYQHQPRKFDVYSFYNNWDLRIHTDTKWIYHVFLSICSGWGSSIMKMKYKAQQQREKRKKKRNNSNNGKRRQQRKEKKKKRMEMCAWSGAIDGQTHQG